MEPQHFRLCWIHYASHLTQYISKLLDSDELSDVMLICEGQTLKAHQLILSSCSPYFKRILVEKVESHPTIILCDIKYTEMKMLLQFMYCGEVNVSQTCVPDFFRIAEVFQVRGFNADSVPSASYNKIGAPVENKLIESQNHNHPQYSNVQNPLINKSKRARKRKFLSGLPDQDYLTITPDIEFLKGSNKWKSTNSSNIEVSPDICLPSTSHNAIDNNGMDNISSGDLDLVHIPDYWKDPLLPTLEDPLQINGDIHNNMLLDMMQEMSNNTKKGIIWILVCNDANRAMMYYGVQ